MLLLLSLLKSIQPYLIFLCAPSFSFILFFLPPSIHSFIHSIHSFIVLCFHSFIHQFIQSLIPPSLVFHFSLSFFYFFPSFFCSSIHPITIFSFLFLPFLHSFVSSCAPCLIHPFIPSLFVLHLSFLFSCVSNLLI